MKYWIAIGCVCLLALIVGGQDQGGGSEFSIKVDQWRGLNCDEPYGGMFDYPCDLMNVDIKIRGQRTYLQQRQGYVRIMPALEAGVTTTNYLYGMWMSQLSADTERVIVAVWNGTIQENTGGSGNTTWRTIENANGGVFSALYSSMVQFKDTLMITGHGGSWDSLATFTKAAVGASPGIKWVASYPWPYRRILLHQDRLYAYGVLDSNRNQLTWMPEFDLRFNNWWTSVAANTGAGFVYISQNDGDFLTNVVPMGGDLIAYKGHSIYRVTISPDLNQPSQIMKVVDNIGAFGYDAVTEYNGIHYFIAQDGVYSFNGSQATKLSTAINSWFQDSITVGSQIARIYKIAAARNHLYINLPVRLVPPLSASVVLDSRCFVYDLETGFWTKYDFNEEQQIGTADDQMLMRYQYNPNALAPLMAPSTYFGENIIFDMDSLNNSEAKKGITLQLFPFGWQDREQSGVVGDVDSITWSYQTGLAPVGSMRNRYTLDRALIYSSTGTATDTFAVNWYSDQSASSLLNSTITPTVAGVFTNRRLSPLVSGSLFRYKISAAGGGTKIHTMEIIGSERGLADETEP